MRIENYESVPCVCLCVTAEGGQTATSQGKVALLPFEIGDRHLLVVAGVLCSFLTVKTKRHVHEVVSRGEQVGKATWLGQRRDRHLTASKQAQLLFGRLRIGERCFGCQVMREDPVFLPLSPPTIGKLIIHRQHRQSFWPTWIEFGFDAAKLGQPWPSLNCHPIFCSFDDVECVE